MSDTTVVIVDYCLGNLFSVKQACKKVGLDTIVSSNPDDILKADGVLLPGVGAFGNAMENLERLDLVQPLKDFAASGGPLFGICLGMQLLFEESEEFGNHAGLGLLPGRIVKFPSQMEKERRLKVPLIGWERIHMNPQNSGRSTYLDSVEESQWMYFVHSFYAKPELASDILTETDFGTVRYCSSVARENIFGTQFHPEKSGASGLRIYESWSKVLSERKVRVQ